MASSDKGEGPNLHFEKILRGPSAEIEIEALGRAQSNQATVRLIDTSSTENHFSVLMENLSVSYTSLREIIGTLNIDQKIAILDQAFDYLEFLTNIGLSMDDGNLKNIYYDVVSSRVKFIDFSQYARNEYMGLKHFPAREQMYRWLKNMGFGSYADEMSEDSDIPKLKKEVMGFIQRDKKDWQKSY